MQCLCYEKSYTDSSTSSLNYVVHCTMIRSPFVDSATLLLIHSANALKIGFLRLGTVSVCLQRCTQSTVQLEYLCYVTASSMQVP